MGWAVTLGKEVREVPNIRGASKRINQIIMKRAFQCLFIVKMREGNKRSPSVLPGAPQTEVPISNKAVRSKSNLGVAVTCGE